MGLSQKKQKTVELLNLAHFFGELLVKQSPDNEDGLITMAIELKRISMEALKMCSCHEISDNQLVRIYDRMNNLLFDDGSNTTKMPCSAFSFFLIEQLESQLFIPKRANGKPKKNGWIRCQNKRDAFQNVLDLIIGMALLFDPDYEDIENAEHSQAISKVYGCLG